MQNNDIVDVINDNYKQNKDRWWNNVDDLLLHQVHSVCLPINYNVVGCLAESRVKRQRKMRKVLERNTVILHWQQLHSKAH